MIPSMKSITLVACLSALAAIPLSRGATFDVAVGGPGLLTFQPESVNAKVGDVVRFTFKQKNHTVTQSTLTTPCAPMAGGFNSGFIPVADGQQDNFPVAELDIQDTKPIWVYCAQAKHCQMGMVFSVNPADKMEQFKAAAMGNNGTQSSASPSPSAPASSAVAPASTSAAPATTSAATVPAASSAPAGTDHRIIVGGPGKLLFDPANITAASGDTVTFEFRQKSHSATQSSFGNPCLPLSQTNTSATQSFDSGLMPVADGVTGNFPTWQVKVNDTNPIWGYCKQATHCQQGMVFSINSNEGSANTFAAFKAKAQSASTNNTNSTTVGGSSATQPNAATRPIDSRGACTALTVLGLLVGSLVL